MSTGDTEKRFIINSSREEPPATRPGRSLHARICWLLCLVFVCVTVVFIWLAHSVAAAVTRPLTLTEYRLFKGSGDLSNDAFFREGIAHQQELAACKRKTAEAMQAPVGIAILSGLLAILFGLIAATGRE